MVVYVFFHQLKKGGSYSDKINYINDIEIEKAVRSSCSYPGIFEPFNYKDFLLIDGGIRENIPWKEIKKMGADYVISIVFEKEVDINKKKNIIDVIYSAIDILSHELSNYEIEGCDYLLKVNTENIGLLDYKKIDELYIKGYNEMKRNIKYIKEDIKNGKSNKNQRL